MQIRYITVVIIIVVVAVISVIIVILQQPVYMVVGKLTMQHTRRNCRKSMRSGLLILLIAPMLDMGTNVRIRMLRIILLLL